MTTIDTTTYELRQPDGGVPVKTWTRGVPVESEALDQLFNIARLPIVHKWVAAMPDVHLGIGATVGSVMPTLGAVIPAAVGVDIGCGMMTSRTRRLALWLVGALTVHEGLLALLAHSDPISALFSPSPQTPAIAIITAIALFILRVSLYFVLPYVFFFRLITERTRPGSSDLLR